MTARHPDREIVRRVLRERLAMLRKWRDKAPTYRVESDLVSAIVSTDAARHDIERAWRAADRKARRK